MIVAKFGGTALADGKNWQKVLNILKENDKFAIVVSAPGARFLGDKKVTDMLYEYYYTKPENAKKIIWKKISERFGEIACFLGVNIDYLLEETRLLTLEADLPYVVSRGEYLSSKLFSLVSNKKHIDSAQKIKFDDNGRIMEKLTEQLLFDACAPDLNGYVLGGFFGSDLSGKIRLFDRGGSDITGALVASAINAELYENWTDVSGFFVCDPRIVLNPVKINCLSFEQLKILSTLGASVLHPQSVYPAQRKNIPINIKSVFKPFDNGTFVMPTTKNQGDILGIVATDVVCFDVLNHKNNLYLSDALYVCQNCGFCTVVLKKSLYDGKFPQNDGILFKREATLVSVLVDGKFCVSDQIRCALNKANLSAKILCDDFGLSMCLTAPNTTKLATRVVYDYFFN